MFSPASSLLLTLCVGFPPFIPDPDPKPAPQAKVGVYLTAADFRRQTPALLGTSISSSRRGRALTVTQKTAAGKHKQRIWADSLWGYVDKDGRTYRYFRRAFYQVVQADSIVLYGRTNVTTLPLLPGTPGYLVLSENLALSSDYYFSAGAQAPVQRLTQANLQKTYRTSNPRFLALLDQRKWYQGLTNYDRKKGTHRLVALHRQSLE